MYVYICVYVYIFRVCTWKYTPGQIERMQNVVLEYYYPLCAGTGCQADKRRALDNQVDKKQGKFVQREKHFISNFKKC